MPNLPDRYESGEYEDAAPGMPEISPLSRTVALALSVTLGIFGAHRFYAGKTGTGLLMLCTMGGMGLWYLYDLILVAAGEFRDADGRVVYNWSQFDRQQRGGAALRSRQGEELQDQLDEMRREMNELAERVDFTERMLAQQRERDKLPRGS